MSIPVIVQKAVSGPVHSLSDAASERMMAAGIPEITAATDM
jgi:hypothetical protein